MFHTRFLDTADAVREGANTRGRLSVTIVYAVVLYIFKAFGFIGIWEQRRALLFWLVFTVTKW